MTIDSLKQNTPEVNKLKLWAFNRVELIPPRHRGAVKCFMVYFNITFYINYSSLVIIGMSNIITNIIMEWVMWKKPQMASDEIDAFVKENKY